LAGPGGGTRPLADLGRRAGGCSTFALVGAVLPSNEAVKACACKARFDLADPHEEARSTRISQRYHLFINASDQCMDYSLGRSRSEAYSRPASQKQAT
jgi:hypothetical protein